MNTLCFFPDFEEIPHKADAAIIVYGHSLPELFSHSALGFYHILGLKSISKSEAEGVIVLQAHDVETLLVSFLTELLYLAEKGIRAEIFELVLIENTLKANYYKDSFLSHSNSIKAVTFNEMKIIEKNGIFQTRIVFDL